MKQPFSHSKLFVARSSVVRTVEKRGELPCLWCSGQTKHETGGGRASVAADVRLGWWSVSL